MSEAKISLDSIVKVNRKDQSDKLSMDWMESERLDTCAVQII